jgi:hypothetical protein
LASSGILPLNLKDFFCFPHKEGEDVELPPHSSN